MSAIRDAGRLGLRGSSPAAAAQIAAGLLVAGKPATTELQAVTRASYTARDVSHDALYNARDRVSRRGGDAPQNSAPQNSAPRSLGLVGAFLAGIVVGVALVVATLALGLAIVDRLDNGRDREVSPDNQTCGR